MPQRADAVDVARELTHIHAPQIGKTTLDLVQIHAFLRFSRLEKLPFHLVRKDAVPWLLLQESGVAAGPTGGRRLTKTTFIQRLNTVGGLAPASGCSTFGDVGRRAFVPYSADYFFYKKAYTR